ncbi:MAG: hypothetical protein P8Z35_18030, partial [Ignavibacteriaceae bacterium]
MKDSRVGIYIIIILISIPIIIHAQQNRWINTGGPYKGVAVSIATGPSGLVLVLTKSGIYRSIDYGMKWQAIDSDVWLNHQIPGYPVYGRIIISNGTTFLITNDSLLFRSMDYGDTWNSVSPPNSLKVRTITSNSINNLYALADSVVILQSVDNGDHWTEINDTLDIDYIRFLTISPDGFLFLSSSNNVYRSSDNGNSWITTLDGSLDLFTFTSDGTVFATEKGFAAEKKIYKSINNGNSWDVSYSFSKNPPTYQTIFDLTSDSAGTVFLMTGSEIYYLENNDSLWHRFVYTARYADQFTAISSGNSSYTYVCLNLAGLFRTRDAKNWNNISPNFSKISLSQISFAPNGIIYAATDSGIARSKDNGITWDLGHSPASHLVTTNSKNIVFAMNNLILNRSTDDGETWTNLGEYWDVGIDKNDKLYTSQPYYPYHVETSTDNGDNWVVADTSVASKSPSCYAFSDNSIFIGIKNLPYNYCIYGSQDGGKTWGFLTQGFLPSIYGINVNSLATDNNGNVFAATDSGLYRSTNNGNHWNQIGQSLPKSILIDNIWINYFGPAIKSIILVRDTIYIGYQRGVFYSTDNGNTWKSLNEGLGSNPYVKFLTLSPNGQIYATNY